MIGAGGDAVEGAITAAQFDPNPSSPGPAALIDDFEEDTGSEVKLNTAYAYDAVYILVDLIQRMGVTNDPSVLAEDRAAIKDGLSTIADWTGMGGPTALDESGNVTRPAQIAIVEDGAFVIQPVGES